MSSIARQNYCFFDEIQDIDDWQVAYSVVDEKAYDREFGTFADLENSNKKILITNDVVDYSSSTVRHIKLEDFLMLEEL